MDEDLQIKIGAIQIAASEMIEMHGEVKQDDLFKRGKELYEAFYEHEVLNWKNPWGNIDTKKVKSGARKHGVGYEDIKNAPDLVKKEKEKKESQRCAPGNKYCPRCWEEIPIGWKKHEFKKDSSVCGYVFD